MRSRWIPCVAGILAIFVVSVVTAETLFVDPSVADGGDGDRSDPLRTLGEALDRVAAGDVIRLRKGTYREALAAVRGRPAGGPGFGSPESSLREDAAVSGRAAPGVGRDEGGRQRGGQRPVRGRRVSPHRGWIHVVGGEEQAGMAHLAQLRHYR